MKISIDHDARKVSASIEVDIGRCYLTMERLLVAGVDRAEVEARFKREVMETITNQVMCHNYATAHPPTEIDAKIAELKNTVAEVQDNSVEIDCESMVSAAADKAESDRLIREKAETERLAKQQEEFAKAQAAFIDKVALQVAEKLQ